jgi:hypothetical protein
MCQKLQNQSTEKPFLALRHNNLIPQNNIYPIFLLRLTSHGHSPGADGCPPIILHENSLKTCPFDPQFFGSFEQLTAAKKKNKEKIIVKPIFLLNLFHQ